MKDLPCNRSILEHEHTPMFTPKILMLLSQLMNVVDFFFQNAPRKLIRWWSESRFRSSINFLRKPKNIITIELVNQNWRTRFKESKKLPRIQNLGQHWMECHLRRTFDMSVNQFLFLLFYVIDHCSLLYRPRSYSHNVVKSGPFPNPKDQQFSSSHNGSLFWLPMMSTQHHSRLLEREFDAEYYV